jgi:thymidylate synthase ThyX
MSYSDFERRLLATYFSVVDGPEHADIYLVRNLPAEVAATLNGVYSRSSKSMRDQFLERLRQGLEAQGKKLEDLPLPPSPGDPSQGDPLSATMTDKSGQFLKTYAIDHGHNSLREGSVVHLAVERVSQLVTRFIQRERRCSFEESSTRYIPFTAETHWRDPDVMAAGGDVQRAYEDVLQSTFVLYTTATERLLEHLRRVRPLAAGEKEAPWLRTLKAEAFDAARYLLTPAIFTKWGMVADARTLADVVTELRSHPLAEFRTVGERIQQQAETVLPTLLKHAKPNAFLQALHQQLPAFGAARRRSWATTPRSTTACSRRSCSNTAKSRGRGCSRPCGGSPAASARTCCSASWPSAARTTRGRAPSRAAIRSSSSACSTSAPTATSAATARASSSSSA